MDFDFNKPKKRFPLRPQAKPEYRPWNQKALARVRNATSPDDELTSPVDLLTKPDLKLPLIWTVNDDDEGEKSFSLPKSSTFPSGQGQNEWNHQDTRNGWNNDTFPQAQGQWGTSPPAEDTRNGSNGNTFPQAREQWGTSPPAEDARNGWNNDTFPQAQGQWNTSPPSQDRGGAGNGWDNGSSSFQKQDDEWDNNVQAQDASAADWSSWEPNRLEQEGSNKDQCALDDDLVAVEKPTTTTLVDTGDLWEDSHPEERVQSKPSAIMEDLWSFNDLPVQSPKSPTEEEDSDKKQAEEYFWSADEGENAEPSREPTQEVLDASGRDNNDDEVKSPGTCGDWSVNSLVSDWTQFQQALKQAQAAKEGARDFQEQGGLVRSSAPGSTKSSSTSSTTRARRYTREQLLLLDPHGDSALGSQAARTIDKQMKNNIKESNNISVTNADTCINPLIETDAYLVPIRFPRQPPSTGDRGFTPGISPPKQIRSIPVYALQ